MADALTLSPELLQQPAIFRAVDLFELHANPFGQRRAVPTSRDGDLECTTPHDGWGDKVTGFWRIDDVHPDVVRSCRVAHGRIDLRLIGSADNQRTTQNIVGAKGSRLIGHEALRRQGCQGLTECGADHHDQRLGVEQPLDLTGGNFPTANHQAAFPLQINKHRIITGHVPLTLTLSQREKAYRQDASPNALVPGGEPPAQVTLECPPASMLFSAQAHAVEGCLPLGDSKSR